MPILSWFAPSPPHYAVLENSQEKTVIQINLSQFTPSIIDRFNKPQIGLSVNTNYFWKGVPIGFLYNKQPLYSLWQPNIRPCLVLGSKPQILPINEANKWKRVFPNSTIFEAGPYLVYDSKPWYLMGIIIGQFREDIYRKSSHTSVGITKANKLIFMFHKSASMETITKDHLKYGCTVSMKFDGGGSSHLYFTDTDLSIKRGKTLPIPVGLLLIPK